MAIDPVCKMNVDEKKAIATSVLQVARKSLMRTQNIT